MKRWIFFAAMLACLCFPVSAMDITAPEAPDSVQSLVPTEPETFGEGLRKIAKEAIAQLQPQITEAGRVCLSLVAAVLMITLVKTMPGQTKRVTELVGTLVIGGLLLSSTGAMIRLGAETVTELQEYGKLLLPVMTAAMAAQGGVTASAALYAGTALFNSVLAAVISTLVVPMVYLYLSISIANSGIGNDVLKRFRDFVKWIMTWSLKIVLYIFFGYMSITGVVSGSADAAAVKAAKLTISGAVPVIGGMLSDASEAVLVGAGVVKSAAGVYGLLVIIALWIQPFLRIGIQHLLLKMTAAVCSVLGSEKCAELIQDFSTAMSFLLAMTGTECLLLMISTVCFLKGVA